MLRRRQDGRADREDLLLLTVSAHQAWSSVTGANGNLEGQHASNSLHSDPSSTGGHKIPNAENEATALHQLNKRRCEHVPKLLTTHTTLVEFDDSYGESKMHSILTTKVPGVTLQDHYGTMSTEEQMRVRKALKVAVQAVHACGVDNGSHHFGNVIWNSEENKW